MSHPNRIRQHAVIPAILIAGFISGCCGEYKDKISGLQRELADIRAAKAESERLNGEKLDKLNNYKNALESRLEKLGIDRKKLSQEYLATKESLAATQKLVDEMRKKQNQARKRLETIKTMLGKFKKMIETGKLSVKVKNNKMVLELPSAVLFDSGKAVLKDDGQATLSQVATVLATIPDREFQVAGHTDNVPLTRRSKFSSNWHLSTARAVAVVSFLQEAGVKPTSLSAAGYSEYQPSVPNDTKENQAKNRRIEITLMPNIEELPDLSDLEKVL